MNNEGQKYTESQHQKHIVVWLREQKALRKLSFDVGMEGIRLKPYQINQVKSQGMDAGVPDIKIKLPNGILVHVELKCWSNYNGLSSPQEAEHALLTELGHIVYMVREKTPEQALNRVKEIIKINTNKGCAASK